MNDMRRTCRCGHPRWTHYARFGPQECLMPGCDCDGFLVEKGPGGPTLLVEDDEPPGPSRRS
jgi:hypothetical protein